MGRLQVFLDERYAEVVEFLAFIRTMEDSARNGAPRIGSDGLHVSPVQYRILFASAYLQLYNLVEATMTQCIDELERAVTAGQWTAADLAVDFRREWVRQVTGSSNGELGLEERMKRSWRLCDHVISKDPPVTLVVERGRTGSWQDVRIEEFLTKMGIRRRPHGHILARVRPRREDEPKALQLVCWARNQLAHGTQSFATIRPNDTAAEIEAIADTTRAYLGSVVEIFESVISEREFVLPERRHISRRRPRRRPVAEAAA